MRNEVKEYYQQEMKAKEEKRLKKEYNKLNGIEEDDSLEEYLKDKLQGRIYMKFYQFIEEKYKYVICPIIEKEVKEEENEVNNENNNILKDKEEKKLSPGAIILKEKSTDFIKWVSSIFQTINDSQITDYLNVNNKK